MGRVLPLARQSPAVLSTVLAQSGVRRKLVYCCLAQGVRGAPRRLQRRVGPQGERRVIIKNVT